MSTEYRAYLIRLRRGQGETDWRITMQNAYSDEERHFANERDLARFLLQTLAEHAVASNETPKLPPNYSAE